MNIFLIGYRCSGKTAVGKALAEKLVMPFVDADRRLVLEAGVSIAEMVAARGWDYFRRIEKEVLKSLCALDAHVIATGGGVVLDAENVSAMKKAGRLVWLQASPQTILKRMRQDRKTLFQRPALTSRGAANEIESTMKERTPYYRAAMNFSIDTDARSVGDICDLIVKRLNFNTNLI